MFISRGQDGHHRLQIRCRCYMQFLLSPRCTRTKESAYHYKAKKNRSHLLVHSALYGNLDRTMKVATHHLRCTECGAVIIGSAVNSIFRCPDCNGLYDVIYPWSPVNGSTADTASNLPNASALRWLWQERRTSTLPLDQSGVWRFRDLFPILENLDNAVTLREGNTPLYDLPRCAKAIGLNWLTAKHQGMNPTGSFLSLIHI